MIVSMAERTARLGHDVLPLILLVVAAAIIAPANAVAPSQEEALLAWNASLKDDAAALSGWTRAALGLGLGGGLDKLDFVAFPTLTELDLNGNYSLNGTIPASISRLSSLKLLDLDNNGLNGSIPPEFGDLSGLVELRLYNNNLVGAFPHSRTSSAGSPRLYILTWGATT
ncbi:hypothetical protein ABZP36_010982 [Zizania latifolia]